MASVEQLASAALSGADEAQVRMMDERVIMTDYFDRPIGAGTKKDSAFSMRQHALHLL